MSVNKNTPEQDIVQSTEVQQENTVMTQEELREYAKTEEFKAMSPSEQIRKIKELTGKTTKQGRPVDPNSARQQKLRNKVPGAKQGRPVDPTSERQKKLREQAEALLNAVSTYNTETE